MLSVGLKHSEEMIVTKELCACSVGSGLLEVFATPSMIALMEQTAMNAVAPYLEADEGTVGTLINVNHSSASPVGALVRCDCELIEIDRRRLKFTVKAFDNAGEIGSGVHERFIINNKKFMEKVAGKLE